MDIKAVLAALEAQGIKLAVQDVAPLVKQLVDLGVKAATKGIADLSHKVGVDQP